ncbi:hypothetical protein ACFLS1_13065, partial [Verrucomicrobiota bacterium]
VNPDALRDRDFRNGLQEEREKKREEVARMPRSDFSVYFGARPAIAGLPPSPRLWRTRDKIDLNRY